MSVSSASGPPRNEFYDRWSAATSDDIRRNIVSRQNTTHDRQGGQQGLVQGLLAPFQACCVSLRPPPVDENIALSPLEIEDVPFSDSESSGTSSGDDVVGIKTTGLLKRDQRDEVNTKTQLHGSLRESLQEHGMPLSNLVSTSKLDSIAHSKQVSTLQQALDAGWLNLSQEDREMIALSWCRRLELSERINEKLLTGLMKSAQRRDWLKPGQRRMDIGTALERQDEFSILEVVRIMEARLMEEVMGEFQSAADAARTPGDGPRYLIISNVRTIASYCYNQGDILSIRIFDTGLSKERGPGFLEMYMLELYRTDPLVAKSSQKFLAWTIKSRSEAAEPVYKSIPPSHPATPSPIDHSVADEEVESESSEELTEAYNAMYHATEDTDPKERVFTHAAGGAIHVAQQDVNKHG